MTKQIELSSTNQTDLDIPNRLRIRHAHELKCQVSLPPETNYVAVASRICDCFQATDHDMRDHFQFSIFISVSTGLDQTGQADYGNPPTYVPSWPKCGLNIKTRVDHEHAQASKFKIMAKDTDS